jgi:hypothetical protein
VVRGTLSLRLFPDAPISPVFSPADLQKGSLRRQLLVASFAAVDQLLDAYRLTGREEFFQLARDNIVAFAGFESSRWLDTGFLWNDHAIAARVPVLIKFWALYRQRADYKPETARMVLSLVARSGMLLAKPEHYSWRTGHGIIQNLALLQISVAFPFLAESRHFRDTAQRRLAAHFPYYVNREGVTLLHSAGYALGGIRLVAMAMRLYTLAGTPIPPEWWTQYEKAEEFYAMLRRPDGTLPMFGDTESAESEADQLDPPRTLRSDTGHAAPAPLTRRGPSPRRGAVGLYPEAGYAVWWYPREQSDRAVRSQTVAAWSHYPGLGHKHADELSVLIWADGRTWLTNVGYWPYGVPGRLQSESWAGSNAPHLRGESAASSRTTRVRMTGSDDDLFFIEMERSGPGDFTARREVLQLGGDTWIVLDRHFDTAPREVETLWTFYPDLSVTPGRTAGSFTISAPVSSRLMQCSFHAAQPGQIERISGSLNPFGGWVVIGQTPTAANAVRVRSGSEQGWQLAVCSLHDGDAVKDDSAHAAAVFEIKDLDRWVMNVEGAAGRPGLTVARNGKQISVTTSSAEAQAKTLALAEVADPGPHVAPVLAAFQASTEISVRRVPLIPYRAKVTYVLLSVLLTQELLLIALRRRWPQVAVSLRIASLLAWIGGGVWLTHVYFVAG